MSDEKKEIEMDAQHMSQTSLTVYQASKFQSSIRMEIVGCFQSQLYINEDTKQYLAKWNESTLLALRNVLNRWYEDKIVNRGKAP